MALVIEAGWRWEGTGYPAEAGQWSHGEWTSEMMDGSYFMYSVLKKKQSWTVAGAGRVFGVPACVCLVIRTGQADPDSVCEDEGQ